MPDLANIFILTTGIEQMTPHGKVVHGPIQYNEYEGETIDIQDGKLKVDGETKGIFYGKVKICVRHGEVIVKSERGLLIEATNKKSKPSLFSMIKGTLKKAAPDSFSVGIPGTYISVSWNIK